MSKDVLNKTRRGGLLMLGGSGISQVCDFVAISLIAQHLGLRGFGLFVGARAIAGVVGYLATPRSWETLLAFWPRLEEERGEVPKGLYVFSVLLELSAGALGILLLLAVAPLLVDRVPIDDLNLCLFLAFTRPACANLIAVNQSTVRLVDRFDLAGLQYALPGMLRLGFVAGFILSGSGTDIRTFLVADAVGSAGAALLGLGIVRFGIGSGLVRRWWEPIRGVGRNMWHFTAANWGASSVKAGTTYGAEVTLLALGTPEGLGTFGLARRVAGMLSSLMEPLSQAFQPEIYRLVARNDAPSLRAYIGKMARDFTVLTILVILVVNTFRDPIMRLVGGEQFTEAGPVLLLIMLGIGVHFAFALLKPFILAVHRPQAIVVGQLVVGSALIGVTALLVPTYAATGAAWGVLVGYLVQVGYFGKISAPYLRLKQPLRD